jgi:ATP-dependent Clp protease ATP-binding subunit ClpA
VRLQKALRRRLAKADRPLPGRVLPVDLVTRRALTRAVTEALHLGHNYIGTEHLLLGLSCGDHHGVRVVLSEQGVTTDVLRASVVDLVNEYLQRHS